MPPPTGPTSKPSSGRWLSLIHISVYADVPRAVWGAAEWSVRAQLAYLAERGEEGQLG